MKKNTKKILAAVLSVLLLTTSAVIAYAMMDKPLEGQLVLPVAKVSVPAVQDGVITGTEYGTSAPVLRLTEGNGLWFEGNSSAKVPEYVDLYLAQDGEALYVALRVREDANSAQIYGLSTFLGFGEDTNAYTMNSGATTDFQMKPCTRTSLAQYLDLQPTKLSAETVSKDGVESAATRRFSIGGSDGFCYPLPHWGSVKEGIDGLSYTTYEIELDFHDSIAGNGTWDKTLPGNGYFGFDLDVYNGSSKVGVLHGNANVTGTSDDPDGSGATVNTAPHILALNQAPEEADGNANLASLSIEDGSLIGSFSPSTLTYKAELPSGTSAVTVNAKAENTKAKVEVFGAEDLSVDNNKVEIRVTAPNGYFKTYTIEFLFTSSVSEYWVDTANGSDENDGSEKAPFASIQKALQSADKVAWSSDAVLNIHLRGTAVSNTTILFNQKTIFTTANRKLPIVIDGGGDATIRVSGTEVAAANDYSFRNLTMPLEGTGVNFFAGSGQVRFDDTVLDEDGSYGAGNPFLCGDTFTARVFEGWGSEQIAAVKKQGKGYIETSITLGKNIQFGTAKATSGCVGTAVGDRGGWANTNITSIRSTDTVVAMILDGAVVPRIAASYYGDANEVHLARAVMLDGDIHILSADGNNTAVSRMTSDISLEMYGGKATRSTSMIRGGFCDIFDKNLTIIMEGGEAAYVQALFAHCTVKGDVTLKVGGTAKVTNQVVGSIGTNNKDYGNSETMGECKNYIYGNASINTFYGVPASEVEIKKVQNYVSGGTITEFYGSTTNASAKIGTVENYISGGTITNFYGAANQTQKIDLVRNEISAGTFTNFYGVSNAHVDTVVNVISGGSFSTFRGTSRDGKLTTDKTLHVSNTVSGGTFANAWDGAFRVIGLEDVTTNISGGTYNGSFLPVWGYNTSVGDVTTNITGGTFNKSAYLGGYGGTMTRSVTCTVGGDAVFNGSCNFGSGSETWPSTVGELHTTVTGGTFKGNTRGGAESLNVTGDLTTIITGGTFNQFFGGDYGAHNGNATAKGVKGASVNGTITTIIGTAGKTEGPVFNGNFYGGHTGSEKGGDYTITTTGKAVTKVYGGTFEQGFCGGSAAESALTGDVEVEIYGGTFKGAFEVGTHSAPLAANTTQTLLLKPDQDITLLGTLQAGKDTESVSIVGADGSLVLGADAFIASDSAEGLIHILQTEEWKVKDYVTFPEGNSVTVKVSTAADAGGIWTTEEGTGGEVRKVLGTDQEKAPGEKATAPTVEKVTYNSVSLAEEEGYEYSMDGKTWQESGTFKGLTAGQSYTFYRRFAETAKNAAGEASEPVTATPEKEEAAAPSAPALAFKTSASVILVEEEGCEYSMDGKTWQESGTFKGLEPETTYTFYRRLAETESHKTSASSEGLSVTTSPPYLLGDMDNNGIVDSDDAIYLLFRTLFGESSYPLNQPADFDGNGTVDSDDAIYLLFHVLFGESSYPLA